MRGLARPNRPSPARLRRQTRRPARTERPTAVPSAPSRLRPDPCRRRPMRPTAGLTRRPTTTTCSGGSGCCPAQLVGEPDAATDLRWCKKCQGWVRPIGKGRCERCNAFLRLNFSARRHPTNLARREALLAKLTADYRPATTMLLASCEHLAAILEQLETLRPGGPDHQRLVQLSQLLGAALEESRSARASRPSPDADGVAAMPMSALEAARDLLARVAAGDVLSEREQGHLDVLMHATRGRVTLPPDPDPLDALNRTPKAADDGYLVAEPGDAGYTEQEAQHATAALEPKAAEAEIARRDREQRDDEADAQQSLRPVTSPVGCARRTRPGSRSRRRSKTSKRTNAGSLRWNEGVLNETSGYRRRE